MSLRPPPFSRQRGAALLMLVALAGIGLADSAVEAVAAATHEAATAVESVPSEVVGATGLGEGDAPGDGQDHCDGHQIA